MIFLAFLYHTNFALLSIKSKELDRGLQLKPRNEHVES